MMTKEEKAEYDRAYRLKNREYTLARMKRYYRENAEVLRRKNISTYYENREKILGKSAEYYRNNREKLVANQAKYARTLIGVVAQIKGSVRNRLKDVKCSNVTEICTPEELDVFLWSNNLEQMYFDWVKSGYDKWMKPSIDRIDYKRGYTIDNIQLVTWRENFKKSNAETGKKTILVKDDKVMEFYSQASASRYLGVSKWKIMDAIKNGRILNGYSVFSGDDKQ